MYDPQCVYVCMCVCVCEWLMGVYVSVCMSGCQLILSIDVFNKPALLITVLLSIGPTRYP